MSTQVNHVPPRSLYPVVSRVLGVLLLAAAGLKGYDVHQLPNASLLMGSRPLTLTWIGFEAMLGIWLLLMFLPRPTRYVAMGLFSLFAVLSSIKGLTGDDSCDCFGRLRAHPWTIFTIDVLAVAALILNPPAARGGGISDSGEV